MIGSPNDLHTAAGAHVFPPALAPVLRERFAERCGCLAQLTDDLLVQLLTTVFFAGLETHEGERNPVGVAFFGTSESDIVLPEGSKFGVGLLYRWKINRFEHPRPFTILELVKLALAGTERRIYSAVHVLNDRLFITGLAREGLNLTADEFPKVIASQPGRLAIRNGRELVLGYDRGAMFLGGEDVVFAAGPIRRVLEETARIAGIEDDGVADYLETVRSLVRKMTAHGRGGILIITPEEHPAVADAATYRMLLGSSAASLLRLAGLVGSRGRAGKRVVCGQSNSLPMLSDSDAAVADSAESGAVSELLRSSFLAEAENVVERVGALTGVDGATVLNRELALVAFGVILPVGAPAVVMEATDSEGMNLRPIDLSTRGTRHRAGASYAAEHPMSVVFVASEGGQISCMFRHPSMQQVVLWRFGPEDV